MNSANSLLGLNNNQQVVANIESTNPLYTPDVPNINDQSVRNIRNIKFKDRYYLDNSFAGQMKNSGDLSLGANNSFLGRNGYDRQIDPNYLRRENPRNKKHTDPTDFYNGSELAFFEIPKRIPRAEIIDPNAISSIDPMDAYQYKQRFISNTNLGSAPNLGNAPMIPTKVKPNMNDEKTIGFAPADIEDIRLRNEQLAKERQQSILNRNIMNATKLPSDLDTSKTGKNIYGEPTIRTGTKVAPKSTGQARIQAP